jgi:chromosomal replication initiation ATPase DnaA
MDKIEKVYTDVAVCSTSVSLEELKKVILLAGNTIYPMTWDDLVGPCKKRELVMMRQLFSYLAYRCGLLETLVEIGLCLNRHHSTIMYSIQTIDNLLYCKDEKVHQIHNFILNHKNT